MKELSPRARALIEAGTEAEGPAEGDRARMQARLTALLGASAFGAAASVATQAAAMASAAGGAAASSGAGAAASGGAAAAAGATGVSAANAAVGGGAAAGASLGGAAANVGGAAAAISAGASLAAGGSGVAAGSGAAAGWVATLGAKGVAWIGAAALTAAVGTTAVVTRQSEGAEHDPRVVAAATKVGQVQRDRAAGRGDVAAALVEDRSGASVVGTTDHSAREAAGRDDGALVAGNSDTPAAAKLRTNLAAGRSGTASSGASSAAMSAARGSAAGSDRQRTITPGVERNLATANTPALNGERSPAPALETAAAQRSAALDSRISAARFAALAASAADARRVEAEHRAAVDVSGQDDAESELLPTPTDPDEMKAVAATPREPLRAAQLPAAEATTPSPAIKPGAQPDAAAALQLSAAAVLPAKPQPGVALSGELNLLAQAQRALHDGKLSLALTLLDQHGAQHAQGTLREERLAARAVVLCRMHRFEAGTAEAQRLAAQTPRSPLLPWVRSSCKR